MVYEDYFKLIIMLFIQNSTKAFKAEWIKLRRSGVSWLILGMSAFIPLIFTLITIFTNDQPVQTESNPWQSFVEVCFSGFAGFFFPIFLILIASRLAQMEHRSAGWKLIETQPVHRAHLFLAKWQVAMLLSLLCLLGVLFFSLLGALVVSFTDIGEFYRKSSLPVLPILAIIFRLWIASLGMLAIQFFLSIWVANFLFSFGIGLLAVITASIISAFGVAPWFPYSAAIFTIRNINGSQTGAFLLHHEWLSLLWMLLFLWIGYQWYHYKSWKFALLKPPVKPLLWLLVAVIFAAGFWWIEKPVKLGRYNKTVIAGRINSTDTIDHLVLLKKATFDTLITIPVTGNKFHYTGNDAFPLGEYVIASGKHRADIIFSGKDSIYINWNWSKLREEAKIGGTRVAENEHHRQSNRSGNNDYLLSNFSYQYTPEKYAGEVFKNYAKSKRKLSRFRTVDNLKPADDYSLLVDKLITYKYLRMLDIDYPRMFAVYSPNDSLKYPAGVDRFRSKTNINDSSLLYFEEYRQFLTAYHHMKSGIAQTRNDSIYFNYLLTIIPGGPTRDMLIYEEMKSVLAQVKDSATRNGFVNKYASAINDPYLHNLVIGNNKRLNNLGRGKPAPDFKAVALNEKDFSLKDFAGRWLVVDVWATWCVPCKKESPFFEQLAEKYTSESVAFISLSVDQDKNAWRADSPDKSKRVLQLWATNSMSLSQYFAIEYIPRFMLIDPKGKIVNIKLPYPSDYEFEEILKKELPESPDYIF